MIMRLKNPKYFPFKTGNGFVIHATVQPQKSLGFATFFSKKKAIAMGKIWYGKYYDKIAVDNFIGDSEKMKDFTFLTKSEFLKSYSYISEEEYDNTKKIYSKQHAKEFSKMVNKELKTLKCDQCHRPISQYQDRKGQGLCKFCIDSFN